MGRFLILGKEERQKYLFQMLCSRGQTVTYCDSWLDGGYDAVMLPVAGSAEYLEQIADHLQAGEYVFGCNFPQEITERKRREGIFFVDYMKEEGAAYTNAAVTAEGAIAEAILGGTEVLFQRPMLVMGYGRKNWPLHKPVVLIRQKQRMKWSPTNQARLRSQTVPWIQRIVRQQTDWMHSSGAGLYMFLIRYRRGCLERSGCRIFDTMRF